MLPPPSKTTTTKEDSTNLSWKALRDGYKRTGTVSRNAGNMRFAIQLEAAGLTPDRTRRQAGTAAGFWTYDKAKAWVQSNLDFTSQKTYNDWSSAKNEKELKQKGLEGYPVRPTELPSSPWRQYRDTGWIDFASFLGYPPNVRGRPNRSRKSSTLLQSYTQAKQWLLDEYPNVFDEVKSTDAMGGGYLAKWQAWRKKQLRENMESVPSNPPRYYGLGWTSWTDFLNGPPPPSSLTEDDDAARALLSLLQQDPAGGAGPSSKRARVQAARLRLEALRL